MQRLVYANDDRDKTEIASNLDPSLFLLLQLAFAARELNTFAATWNTLPLPGRKRDR